MVPCVASVDALLQLAAEFVVADLDLVAEPAALAAAQQSLDDSGLLLLGEVHGVRENPLLIRVLMQTFGLTSLALEWPDDLASVIGASWPAERWPTPGTRILLPATRSWVSRWGLTSPSDGQVSATLASTTAAGNTTTSSRAGCAPSARHRPRYAFTSMMARLFSTCPQREKRSCPTSPGRGCRRHARHPECGRTGRHEAPVAVSNLCAPGRGGTTED